MGRTALVVLDMLNDPVDGRLANGAAKPIIDPLTPAEGDLRAPKRFYSASTQTDLDTTCRVRDIDRVVRTGQHTDCCCRHTAYDAFQRGLDVGGRGETRLPLPRTRRTEGVYHTGQSSRR